MEINLNGVSKRHDGFGVAGRQIEKSLINLGHTIDKDAHVSLNFAHPHSGKYSDGYDILYMPWESTLPLPGWKKYLSAYDEIWATSPWVKEVIESWGFKVQHVYLHGVDQIWEPVRRVENGRIRFLFLGFEAYRKGAYEAIHAFRAVFGNSMDVELVIKTTSKGAKQANFFPNITFIDDDLSTEDLVKLFHSCHVLIAPTYGEGFGLPGLDALASGMPIIHTEGFSPYHNFMHSSLIVKSDLIDSPWPKVHPGKMYKPDHDALVKAIKHFYRNTEDHFYYAAAVSNSIHDIFNWDKLTDEAFSALEERVW